MINKKTPTVTPGRLEPLVMCGCCCYKKLFDSLFDRTIEINFNPGKGHKKGRKKMPTGEPSCPIHGMTPCRCAEIRAAELLRGTPEYSDTRASIYDLKGIAPDCTGKEDSVQFVRKLRESQLTYHHPATEPKGHPVSECAIRGCNQKKEPWPSGFGITIHQRCWHHEYESMWIITAGDRCDNEVKLQSTSDRNIFWIGSAQEFQKTFTINEKAE